MVSGTTLTTGPSLVVINVQNRSL